MTLCHKTVGNQEVWPLNQGKQNRIYELGLENDKDYVMEKNISSFFFHMVWAVYSLKFHINLTGWNNTDNKLSSVCSCVLLMLYSNTNTYSNISEEYK